MNLFDLIDEPVCASNELRDRTWWRYLGDDVEIRGTSPVMVWFTRRGESQLAQRTVPRAEFLKKAKAL